MVTLLALVYIPFHPGEKGTLYSFSSNRSVTERDSASFERVHQRANAIESIRSLLIQQGGARIAENYFDGMSAGQTANMKSASKSVISLLVGIAIDKGFIEDKDQHISGFFPEYYRNISNELKKEITIEDLLTMRSGLETTSFHNYGRWVTSDDWVEYALEQPMVDRPGDDMEYSTGTSHLLSVIITKATEMSTLEFAQKYLFDPLNIAPGDWQQDPQGYYFGGNNMALKPTDMVKIGQLVLNGGTYNGNRVVSEEWIRASFKTYTRSNYNPYDYGYMWWNKRIGEYRVFFAWGFGGQYIYIIPELDSVVVITSSLRNATQSRRYKEPVFQLLENQIIPLVRNYSAPIY